MMAALLICGSAMGQSVEGFAELRAQVYTGVDADAPVFFVERFRPSFDAPLGDRVVVATTIEAGLSQGWTTLSALEDRMQQARVPAEVVDGLGLPAYTNEVLRISQAQDYLAVDRLYIEAQLQSADLRVGRQALNWGSGFAVNPSDPFPEVLLTEPWKPRSGINAARVDVPIGDMHGVVLVAGSDDAFQHPRLAARATANVWQTDWSMVGAWREEIDEGIAGVDIKGTLGVGFWFEGVMHLPADDSAWEELATGLDYSFPVLESLIVTAQYYRNGSGQADGAAPSMFTERTAFAPAFSGRDYLMASAAVGVLPELSLSTLWMQNLGDATAFVVPSAAFLATDTVDVSLAAQIPVKLSGYGEFVPDPSDLQLTLPTTQGDLTTVDLARLVPAATFILWTRFNF